MRHYIVSGFLTISVRKPIAARDEHEAREIAGLLEAPGLCHSCDSAGSDDPNVWELNGFDDPPDDCVTEVEEIDD